jgi:hypothetical protein
MEAHARAVRVLTENRPLLDIVAAQLLERETLTREDIAILEKGETLPPRIDPPTTAPLVPAAPVLRPEPTRVLPPLAGPEPTPA